MPVYDYVCDQCGEFSALKKMGPESVTAECPSCGQAAGKVISAPRLGLLGAEKRDAMARNERAQHAPQFTRKSCGCSGAHTCGPSSATNSTTGTRVDGKPSLERQKKSTARPWMLGH